MVGVERLLRMWTNEERKCCRDLNSEVGNGDGASLDLHSTFTDFNLYSVCTKICNNNVGTMECLHARLDVIFRWRNICCLTFRCQAKVDYR